MNKSRLIGLRRQRVSSWRNRLGSQSSSKLENLSPDINHHHHLTQQCKPRRTDEL